MHKRWKGANGSYRQNPLVDISIPLQGASMKTAFVVFAALLPGSAALLSGSNVLLGPDPTHTTHPGANGPA